MSEEDKKKKPFRPATVSSGTPLRHKDKMIDQATRDRFEALHLETLLSEFKRVAESDPIDDDEEEETAPEASSDDKAIQEQEAWLHSAGFETLTQQVHGGRPITDEDLHLATAGYSASQRRAVATRARVLNATLTKKESRSRSDARDLFRDDSTEDAASDVSAFLEVNQRTPTLMEDLSDEDLQQLQRLTLIQLTAMLEAQGTSRAPVSKKKRRKRKIEGHVFGNTLIGMVERDHRMNPKAMESRHIPVFLTNAIKFLENHLDEEGLFRKAGSAARIKEIRAIIEKNWGDVDFTKEDCRPHDVAAILKQFLRETAEPLLTEEYIEAFSMTQSLKEKQLYGLRLVVSMLPKVHAACLEKLLSFLLSVSDRQSENKMTIANLAVVFAPTLFYLRGAKGQQMLKEVELQVTTASTLKIMLERCHDLWQVPSDMIAQMRYVNESKQQGLKASKKKDIKRLLADKKASSLRPQKGDDGSILWISDSKATPPVRAVTSVIMNTGEVMPKVSITDTTTSADVLKLTHSPENANLYECGGNISRRRLAADNLILPVLRVNPSLNLMVM